MKHVNYPLLILSLILCACSKPAETDETTPEKSPDIAQPEATQAASNSPINYQPSLLTTITGADNIAKLQQDLHAIEAAQRNMTALISAISSDETDSAKKAELQAALEIAETEYNESSEKILQAYGIDFKSTNEYIFSPQKAQIFIRLTNQEIADQKETSSIYKGNTVGFSLTKELDSAELIQQFQADLNIMNQMRQAIAQMQQSMATTTEEKAKAELEENIKQASSALAENDKVMFDTYGHTLSRPNKISYIEMDIYIQAKLPQLNDVSVLADDYVLVGTLEGIETNQDFQRNVQIMQALRNDILMLSQQIQSETDEAKKAQLREQFEALNTEISKNNQTMTEAYKYSLDRNYSQVTKKARIYIQLTQEEIEKQKELDPNYSVPEDGMAEVVTIQGVTANQDFKRNVQIMQSLRSKIIQAQQALELETDETKKAERQAQIDQATEMLIENNKQMVGTYKYSLDRNYQYVIEDSDLYLQLTREEISNLDPAQ